MCESAKEIRSRLSQSQGEFAAQIPRLLKECLDTNVPWEKIEKKQRIIERQVLQDSPWTPKFFLGTVNQPDYAHMLHILSDPSAQFRTEFISGALETKWIFNSVIWLNQGLWWGGLVLVIMSFIYSWLLAIAGIGCWLIWFFILNNVQTLLNIKYMARLSVYDEVAEKKGKPIIMKIVKAYGCSHLSESGNLQKGIEYKKPTKFHEPQFKGISWGMRQQQVSAAYGDSILMDIPEEKITEFKGPPHLTCFSQALFGTLYKHGALLGFKFSKQGLYETDASFHFTNLDGRKLTRSEIWSGSEEILSALKRSYGNPSYLMRGSKSFSYQWVFNNIYIHFGYDGENGWGIHYRSIKLDPDIEILLDYTRKEFSGVVAQVVSRSPKSVKS
ncbi:MAG: hypothetical protein Q7R35_18510 [Elusimicrobiota bacterium]|nr:hypothetical protein [Elusimicrobiota bacterium]